MDFMGKIFLLTGPSAVGKSTLVNYILDKFSHFVKIPSYTTREKSLRDREGIDYFFVKEEEFKELEVKGYFLETSFHYGNFYGTPTTKYFESLEDGFNIIKDIDVNGAKSFKEEFGDLVVTIYVTPPSLTELKRRMVTRDGFLDEERSSRIIVEQGMMNDFDHILLNGDLNLCLEDLERLIFDYVSSYPFRGDGTQKSLLNLSYGE